MHACEMHQEAICAFSAIPFIFHKTKQLFCCDFSEPLKLAFKTQSH